MRIRARLYDDQELDPFEPSGEILIGGDEHGTIQRHSAWLDDWLTALMEALRGLREQVPEQELDLPSEPEPLFVDLADDGVFLAFEAVTARFNTADDLERELRQAIRDVVGQFGPDAELEEHEGWAALVRFARSET